MLTEIGWQWTVETSEGELVDVGVDHPPHYRGKDSPYETIKVIEAWDLDFCLGNAIKYISRAGLKTTSSEIQDLEKAIWYIQRRIHQIANNPNRKR